MGGELSLGACPQALIPGNPDDVERLADRLRTFADGMGEAAGRFGALTPDEWKGPAGDAFRTLVGSHPKKYGEGRLVVSQAATVIRHYAGVLREAQTQAQRAIDLYEQAHVQTQDWERHWEKYDADVRAAAGSGTAPASLPPARTDPGADDRSRAQHLLDDASSLAKVQAHRSSMELAPAAEAAPRKPGLLESIVADVGGALGTGVGAATGGWGVITGTLGDVGGWVADTWGDAAGWMETLGPSLLEVAAGGVLVFAGAEMTAAAAAVEVGGVALDATGVGGIQGAGRQMIEPNEIVSSAADLAKINALVGKLEGQPCWRLKFTSRPGPPDRIRRRDAAGRALLRGRRVKF